AAISRRPKIYSARPSILALSGDFPWSYRRTLYLWVSCQPCADRRRPVWNRYVTAWRSTMPTHRRPRWYLNVWDTFSRWDMNWPEILMTLLLPSYQPLKRRTKLSERAD